MARRPPIDRVCKNCDQVLALERLPLCASCQRMGRWAFLCGGAIAGAALKLIALFLLVLVVLPAPAAAQSLDLRAAAALAWPAEQRPVANRISYVTVATAAALPCLVERSRACLRRELLTVGATVAIAEMTKRLVHRDRPDHFDRLSFFSEHTAIACVAGFQSKRQVLGAILCAATAYLRTAARRHWLSDVLAGAGVGFVVTKVIR